MSPKDREWIEKATLEQLLSRWRFAPIGDTWFQDAERAKLHQDRMAELRNADPAAWTRASKALSR